MCRGWWVYRPKLHISFIVSFRINFSSLDEFLFRSHCGPNTNCVNSVGSYSCTCKIGFQSWAATSGFQNFSFITLSKSLFNKYNFCKIFILIINLQFINAFLYCLVPVLVLQIAKYLHITGCSDIDECTANTTYTSDYCNNLASCTNNVGSWTCTCNTGIPKFGIEMNFS